MKPIAVEAAKEAGMALSSKTDLRERGFLDGRSGLVYHFLQGYWYRFLVGARVMELQQAVAHLHDKAAICAELSRLTGHKLVAQSAPVAKPALHDDRLAARP